MTEAGYRAARLLTFVMLAATLVAQAKGSKTKTTAPDEPQRIAFGSSYYLLDVPAGATKEPRPLIVMLHGSGGRPEHYRPCYLAAVDRGYAVCLPASIDPASYDDRDEKQVIAMVEDVLRRHAIDRDRILLSGHSAGAALSFFLVSKRPDLFTACAAGAAGLRFPAEQLRASVHVPFYVATGGKDFNRKECERSRQPLQALGIAVTWRDEPAWDHGLAPDAWTAMFSWFDALIPREQCKALQAARASLDAGAFGKGAAALAKLRDAKGTTDHAKQRIDVALAAIDRAAADELGRVDELIDQQKFEAAVARLEKARAAFAGTSAEQRIADELSACRRQLPAK